MENKSCVGWNSGAFLFGIYFLQKKMFFHFVGLSILIWFFLKKLPLIIEKMGKVGIIDNWRIVRMADEISFLAIFIILLLSGIFGECLYRKSNNYNIEINNNEKYKKWFNYILIFLFIGIILAGLFSIIWIFYAITHGRQ